jgi:hypothetical protein
VVLWRSRPHSNGVDLHHLTCVPVAALPNKRLKLAGGDLFKGSGVLYPGGHELSFNRTAPCGRVARSLSAIR